MPKKKTTEPVSRSSFLNQLLASGPFGTRVVDIFLAPRLTSWFALLRPLRRMNYGNGSQLFAINELRRLVIHENFLMTVASILSPPDDLFVTKS